MFNKSTKRGLALGLALSAVLGATLTGGQAHADPQQFSAYVGVGSDTVQAVMNAFSGFSNGNQYTPLTSSVGTRSRQIISFDAVKPTGTSNCITTKLNGSSFYRPNGSTAGRKALAAANGGSATGWTGAGGCGTAVDISGQVDFARSSSLPSGGGADVTFIPFGRDGVSFATYRNAGSAVTNLTVAQLQSLYTSGPTVINGVRIVPCGIQTSSGTYSFWNSALGEAASSEATATAECNTLAGTLAAPGVRIEENDGTLLKNKGTALAAVAGHTDDQVIVAFSAAAWIAETNLVAPGAPPAGVALGTITDVGAPPFDGSGTSLTPNTTYFNSTTFGRNVYVVITTEAATGPGNAALKELFVGPGAQICAAPAVATLNRFGFLATASCGSTATTRAFEPGAS